MRYELINNVKVKGYKDRWVRSNKISLGILVKTAMFYIFEGKQDNR